MNKQSFNADYFIDLDDEDEEAEEKMIVVEEKPIIQLKSRPQETEEEKAERAEKAKELERNNAFNSLRRKLYNLRNPVISFKLNGIDENKALSLLKEMDEENTKSFNDKQLEDFISRLYADSTQNCHDIAVDFFELSELETILLEPEELQKWDLAKINLQKLSSERYRNEEQKVKVAIALYHGFKDEGQKLFYKWAELHELVRVQDYSYFWKTFGGWIFEENRNSITIDSLSEWARIDSEKEASKQEVRIKLRKASYALLPHPPIEWIVDNLISAGSVNLFFGEPGTKKTYSLISMAVCAALGKSWLNFTTKKVNVLLIDEESGERRLAKRLASAIRGENGDGNIGISSTSLAQFKLENEEDISVIKNLISYTEAELVIIDSLSAAMDGDENSKQDTQPIFNNLRKLAESTKCAIIVIHHSNKGGSYRGSSAIKGAIDLMIRVESDNGSNQIDFISEKTRDTESVEFSAVPVWEEGKFYLRPCETTKKEKRLSKSQEYVIQYLTKNGPSRRGDIMSNADVCTQKGAEMAIYSLVKMERIERVNAGGQGKTEAVYSLKSNINAS